MNELNLTAFNKAIATLQRALIEYAKDKSNEFVRDACIQRFEYCYDLATKIIKRYLKDTSPDPSAIEVMTFQDLIRTAYGRGILKNSWDQWWQYRDNRALTSHSYVEAKAISIVEKLDIFYNEILYLYQALDK